MIDQKVSMSRRNSLSSVNTTSSNISNTTASNVTTAPGVRNLSTNNLVSIDDKFVRKTFKRSSSEVNFHKAQGTYYFPNGEVFRPRISPARRNKPGKINPAPVPPGPGAGAPGVPVGGTGEKPMPISRHGSTTSVNDSNAMYHYAPTPNKNNNANVPRTASVDSLSSLHQLNLPRSHSSSNVRKLQSKNLAQSLRSNKADTPTNISLFQQHLNQQLQQHQPGQLPQHYSQQFQQFQQFQSQQPNLPQQAGSQPNQPNLSPKSNLSPQTLSPQSQFQPQFQQYNHPPQQHIQPQGQPQGPPSSQVPPSQARSPQQGQGQGQGQGQVQGPRNQQVQSARPSVTSTHSMPGGFPQYDPSNNSSTSSFKNFQANMVKNLGILSNSSENSIENNTKSDSNLSSVSNYTLIRSASNTPQTSISNSLDDDKSSKSRPTSSAQESIDETSILKETEKEQEIDVATKEQEIESAAKRQDIGEATKEKETNTASKDLELAEKRKTPETPETEHREIFSTPMTISSMSSEIEKFSTPLTSPVNEPNDIFEDKDYLNLGGAIDPQQSITSSVYSQDEEVPQQKDSDVTPTLTPIPTPGHVLDTKFSSPRTITPSRQEFDEIVHDDDNSSNYSSTRSSSFPSPSQSPSQSPSHSHEDVDDLLNDYQNESPMSKQFVDYDRLDSQTNEISFDGDTKETISYKEGINAIVGSGDRDSKEQEESKEQDELKDQLESKDQQGEIKAQPELSVLSIDEQEQLSEVIRDDSVPKRGDISVVDDKVVRDSRMSSSSSFNSLASKKLDEQKAQEKEAPERGEQKEASKEELMPSPTVSDDEEKGEVEKKVSVDKSTSHNPDSPSMKSSPFIGAQPVLKPVAPVVKSMLDVSDSVQKPKSMLDVGEAVRAEIKKNTQATTTQGAAARPADEKIKTPTKPKKKVPSGSPLVERVPRPLETNSELVLESVSKPFDKLPASVDKSLPTTPTKEKKIKTTKSFGSLNAGRNINKSIWKKMFNKKPGTEHSSPVQDLDVTEAQASFISSRPSVSSRTSTDAKSIGSIYDTSSSAVSVSSKPSTGSKFRKLTASKKSFSFKDLRISSFKHSNDEAHPLPQMHIPVTETKADPVQASEPVIVPEELTLTKLPSIERDDNLFGDVLMTFDEKLDKVGRKATVKHTSLSVNEPFLKDDELTRDQIDDQRLKDTKSNGHSRSNSDDYIDENLQFLKDELIWPLDGVQGDVKSVRSSRSIEEAGNRNSVGIKSIRSTESEELVGGEEDVFYIDNEQLNNLFNNITDNQRRKLPMHLKYIKQFKDYKVLEINIKKFENLTNSKLVMKGNKVDSILKKSTKYGARDSLSSRDRKVKPERKPKNSVQFSNKIVVNETFSPDIYSRYNKSVTQYTLTEPVEITKVKSELNEFKCNEMLVHERSQNNTHFFY